MSDVFISYARSTEAQARQIGDALRTLGYSVWRDDDLPAHRDYSDVIEERLRAAKAVVVVWSAEAVKSQWVRAEADLAREAGTLVQLTLDGALLPMPFNRIQCADLTSWSGEPGHTGWVKVLGSVSALSEGGSAAPSAPLTPPRPDVRYAHSGEIDIAYITIGEGPLDVVIAPGMWSHLEALWPLWAPLVVPLSRRARVIMFDKRGQGMSDRMVGAPTLEERMDDIRAVMDAAGSTRAVLLGQSEGGPMILLFAASHPDRVLGLVMVASFAKLEPDGESAVGERVDRLPADWGKGLSKELIFPDAPISREQAAQIERLSSTPGNAARQIELVKAIDVRAALPAIRAPTLILHREHDSLIPVARARELAEHIPGARLALGSGSSHAGFDAEGVMAAALMKFLGSLAPSEEAEERLATVLICRGGVGARAFANAERLRGKALPTHDGTGETAYVFDGPSRAVECAIANRAGAPDAAQGLTLGIVALAEDRVGGPAPTQAAEVAALAGAGEILLTRTLRDVLAGTRFTLAEVGHTSGDLPCYRVDATT